MKAVVYEEYGQPDVLTVGEVNTPEIARDEVLVQVLGAAVNPGDWFLLNGVPYLFRPAFGLSKPRHQVLGLAISGIVAEVGSDVSEFRPGDEVYAEVSRGGFAEYSVVRAEVLAHKPQNLTFEEAAGVPVVGTTALQALRDVGQVEPGEKVLINGASGGVGTFAVQIAKWLGAEVTGVCSGPNAEMVRSLGADHVIDYTQADFTVSGGYDLIVDNVANRTLRDLRKALSSRGLLVLNSGSGSRWAGPLGRMVRAIVMSIFIGQRMRPFANRPNRNDLEALTKLIETGAVTPVLDSTYTLDEAAEALGRYGSGHSSGKVVISVGNTGRED